MIASVRTAKAKLSQLLERAARGEDVVITSDGRAKARLVAVVTGVPFRVNRRLLRRKPRRVVPLADRIVRDERDTRD